jgi:hypothetical protein
VLKIYVRVKLTKKISSQYVPELAIASLSARIPHIKGSRQTRFDCECVRLDERLSDTWPTPILGGLDAG